MDRIILTDGTGGWFDADSARIYRETTFWDGHNRISKATGSQWNHEDLYRTKSGKWILHHWSQWQGSSNEITEISDHDAAVWLSLNEYEDIPTACKTKFDELEIK